MSEYSTPALDSNSRIAPERMGSGTRTGSKFLRDDGTWQTVAGGSIDDDAILDLVDTSRDSSDRGKAIGTSTTDQDQMAFLGIPTGYDRGAYQQSTAYLVGDIVSRSGNVYRCKTAHTSPASGFTEANWDQVNVGAGDIELSHLAQGIRDEINAQSSLLSIWDGLDDPLTEGWMSNESGKYDSTNKIWPVIGSAASTASNDKNNQLYQDNSNVDWQRSFVFRWRHRYTKPSGANNENGALQVFWGGDAFATEPSWLGSGVVEGLGFWIQRAREASNRILAANDNWMFFAPHAQNPGIGGSPGVYTEALSFLLNSASHTTLYNGALRPRTSSPYLRLASSGWANQSNIGFFVPETADIAEIRVQGLGEYVYLYVNETLYARIDLSGTTGVTFGPRFGWLGDGGGTDGNRCLIYNAFVGTPDPINIVPRQYDGADLKEGSIPASKLAPGAGGSFDLHDDVTTELTTLDNADRILVSDEGTTDDPNRWASLSRLRTWLESNLSLAAGRITSGTFAIARIPDLAASKITSGTLDAARIPGLAASKINSGVLAVARLGTGTADSTKVLYGDGTWKDAPGGGRIIGQATRTGNVIPALNTWGEIDTNFRVTLNFPSSGIVSILIYGNVSASGNKRFRGAIRINGNELSSNHDDISVANANLTRAYWLVRNVSAGENIFSFWGRSEISGSTWGNPGQGGDAQVMIVEQIV